MGLPRDELLLMARALKRGFADLKAIRRALERQLSKPIPLLEALGFPPSREQALRDDPWRPDLAADTPLLSALRQMLVEGDHLTSVEWDKFVQWLSRGSERHDYPPIEAPREFDGYTLQWELARRERGVVYRARDGQGRDVAIKIFRKEIAAPELPRVGEHAYAASPFVEGESLERRRPPLRRGVEIIEKAARAAAARPHGALSAARLLVRKDESVALVGYEYAHTSRAAGPDDLHALGAILREFPSDPALGRVAMAAGAGFYADPSALADDLARWLRGEAVAAPEPAVPRAARPRLWPWAAALLLVLGFWAFRRAPVPPPVADAPPATGRQEEPARAPEAIAPAAESQDGALRRLAQAYAERNELDKALEYAARALDLAPGSRESLRLRARILALRGEARKAMADFSSLWARFPDELDREIQADPPDARALLLRGAMHYFRGRRGAAIEDFTGAGERGQPRAFVWRAIARASTGDGAGAAADARLFLAAHPADFAAGEARDLLRGLESK